MNPRSVEGLTGLGNTLYTVGDYTRAGVYYGKANEIDPAAPAPMVGLASVASTSTVPTTPSRPINACWPKVRTISSWLRRP